MDRKLEVWTPEPDWHPQMLEGYLQLDTGGLNWRLLDHITVGHQENKGEGVIEAEIKLSFKLNFSLLFFNKNS